MKMILIMFILTLLGLLDNHDKPNVKILYSSINYLNSDKKDTNKRYFNMINYISKDSVIKDILYRYYPVIDCFDLPEIALPDTVFRPLTLADIDYYLFITNDTNKSIRYKYDLIKKIDSINLIKYKNKKYTVEYTNYKLSDSCSSIYDFEIFFNEENIWGISIVPKVTHPGLWRMMSYIFVFDDEDNILRTKVYHAVE